MFGIGVVEGFFGPEWSWASRHRFCESLPSYGGSFYLYAPKRDACLRRSWAQQHTQEAWIQLKRLSRKCHENSIAFGVGLSPFELHANWSQRTKHLLREKLTVLHELDIQYLGLFFDDMKGTQDLADRQIDIVEYVRRITDTTILFCPTYYTHDPILDKVFGPRPPDYLEKIGHLPTNIQILWTGNRVISRSITDRELDDVAKVLQRKPVVWDNYFANDGPKQCKFLKLRPLEGRTPEAFQRSAGWAFNLMNQPCCSELVFAAAVECLNGGERSLDSFYRVIARIAGPRLEFLLKQDGASLMEAGLDAIQPEKKRTMLTMLGESRFSQELSDWFDGKYVVGEECLTD